MKAYRVSFFQQLGEALAHHGVDLQVVYGRPYGEEAQRGDNVPLPAPWGLEVANWQLPGTRAVFQACVAPWARADLVIVEHANKHLLSWLLLGLRAIGLGRVAFWGHGRDRKADPRSRGERLKRRSLHWADWWFAYTAGAAAYVAEQGYDAACITAVGNAVDTRGLALQLAAVSADALQQARQTLGLQPDDAVGLYCGSLYPNKRLDILFDAADRLQARLPRFKLLVMGGGELAAQVQAYCDARPWAHALGPRFGQDKALYLKLATVWLNPGALGLAILDAFVAGLPLITTHCVGHGPEIEYLQHGRNGLILPAQADAYADAVAALLDDTDRLQAMQAQALRDASAYSIEAMVAHFAQGVRQALARA